MDKWLDSLSVSQTTRVRIPLNVLFFFSIFFLSLLAWADICAAELATWGVGPDVYQKDKLQTHSTTQAMFAAQYKKTY